MDSVKIAKDNEKIMNKIAKIITGILALALIAGVIVFVVLKINNNQKTAKIWQKIVKNRWKIFNTTNFQQFQQPQQQQQIYIIYLIFVKNCLKLIEEAQEDKKELYKNALDLGLKAFTGEVGYNED